MACPIPTDPHARIADILRIGNRAARAVQEANRRRGIPNWYSLGGVIVSDAGATAPPRDSGKLPATRDQAARAGCPSGVRIKP